MRALLEKYSLKLVARGLALTGSVRFLGLDAALTAVGPPGEVTAELARVFDLMNINCLLFAAPAEPYGGIIDLLVAGGSRTLTPRDCETTTFLHDIPVIESLRAGEIADALSERKAAVIRGLGIVAHGGVTPEQAFISFSSVCFSTFVAFFTEILYGGGNSGFVAEDATRREKIRGIIRLLSSEKMVPESEIPDAPLDGNDLYSSIAATGRQLVERDLVDSYFGNISYVYGSTIFISQTGSSLDELEGCIDAVPLDGSSSAGITASSELSAHIAIHRKTGKRAILHGHPKFTVILSMSCRRDDCDLSTCYRSCRQERSVLGIPVVAGEIGTGSAGLMHTVPDAMIRNDAVIVFGHGIFAAGARDFRDPFKRMESIERECREDVLARTHALF